MRRIIRHSGHAKNNLIQIPGWWLYSSCASGHVRQVFATDAQFVCVDNVNWATGHFLQNFEHLTSAVETEREEELKRARGTKWDRLWATPLPLHDAASSLQYIANIPVVSNHYFFKVHVTQPALRPRLVETRGPPGSAITVLG
eukprot:2829752-Amphidinium_carterae.1